MVKVNLRDGTTFDLSSGTTCVPSTPSTKGTSDTSPTSQNRIPSNSKETR